MSKRSQQLLITELTKMGKEPNFKTLRTDIP